jgi:hypothetical protein
VSGGTTRVRIVHLARPLVRALRCHLMRLIADILSGSGNGDSTYMIDSTGKTIVSTSLTNGYVTVKYNA